MIKINLLADRNAKDRIRIQQQITLALLATVVMVVGVFFWWQSVSLRVNSAEAKIGTAEAELRRQAAIRAEMKTMEDRRDRIENIHKAISDLETIQAGPVGYLDTINLVLPKEMWLTSLSEKDGNLEIEGFSFTNPSVAQFLKSLDESEEILRVELKETSRADVAGEALYRFKIACETVVGKKLATERANRAAAEEARRAELEKKAKKK